MSTDTPRTDAVLQRYGATDNWADLITHARQLERELSALSANWVSVPVSLKAAMIDFSDFLNEPPQYEDKRMVRDYRHEAYRHWEKLSDKIHAAFAAPAPAGERVGVPAVLFNDPRVQIVYELLCDGQCPDNSAEHWEGWIARRIVGALSAAPEPAVKMASVPVDQLRIIWDQLAVGRRFLPSHGSFGEQGISAYETAQKIVRAMLSAQPTAEPATERRIGKPERRSDPGSWLRETGNPIDRRVAAEPAAQSSDAQTGDGMCGCGDPDCHIAIGGPHTDLAGDHNK